MLLLQDQVCFVTVFVYLFFYLFIPCLFSYFQFRSLFFGSVLPTPSQMSNQTLQSQDVLASDSEDENSP